MSREARLVFGPQPFPTKVLVVGGDRGLHDKMLECLEGCNVTLEIKEGEHEEMTKADLDAVMILGSSIPSAVQIQKHSTGSAFLYCAQVMLADAAVVYGSLFVCFQGDEVAGLYCCPRMSKVVKCPRPDKKMVTVAQVSGGLGGGVLVTTNRPHCLSQKDTLLVESGLVVATVQEVVAPSQIVVDVRGGSLEVGQRLEVEREEREWPTLEQEVERLAQDEEMRRFLANYSRENCQTKGWLGANMGPADLVSLAGLLANSLLSLLHHQTLPAGLRLVPSPTSPSLPSSTSLLISPSSDSLLSSTVSSILTEMGLSVKFVVPDLGQEERSALFSNAGAVISVGGSFDLRRAVEALCVEHSLPLLDLAVEGESRRRGR